MILNRQTEGPVCRCRTSVRRNRTHIRVNVRLHDPRHRLAADSPRGREFLARGDRGSCELLRGADRVVRVTGVDDVDIRVLLHDLVEALVIQNRRAVAGEPADVEQVAFIVHFLR